MPLFLRHISYSTNPSWVETSENCKIIVIWSRVILQSWYQSWYQSSFLILQFRTYSQLSFSYLSSSNSSHKLHQSKPTLILTLTISHFQCSSYALSCFVFAYAEGYKGFHKKFAPLVVKRSFTLIIGTRQGNNPLNYFLAPLYSMGLWGATKKRLIVSWGVTTGVALLVAIVKKLPQAPRCILDAGVVVGLTIGSASILYHFARSLVTGKLPDVDACLPNETSWYWNGTERNGTERK